MKLYQFLLDAAKEEPNHTAVEFKGQQIPFGFLAQEAMRVGAGLVEQGMTPGTSIGVMLPNIPQFLAVHYGTLLSGCVFVPFNVMLQGDEIEYLVTDSDIRVIVTYEMFLDQVAEGIRNRPEPPRVFVVGQNTGPFEPYSALLGSEGGFQPVEVDANLPVMTLYTSGTTGKPKGAQITNANVIANLDMMQSILPVEEGDRTLCVLPLFHVYALNGVMHHAIRNRTAIVLHTRFEAQPCIQSLAEDGITSFAGVPTMYFYMLKEPMIHEVKFPRLRHCISGGAAIPVEVITQWEKVTGVPIYEGFGLTETTVSVCINRPERRKVGSIGLPYDGVEMK
ncbi:MAG: AMP-binding protein, partial [Pirellulales bacterium]